MTDPRSRRAFTEAGAWEYVVEQIVAGAEMTEIVLKKPVGKKGYVFKIPSANPPTKIYVKLQIGSGCVIGRSFHEEDV